MLALSEGRKIFNVSNVGWSGNSGVYYKKNGKIMMGDSGGTAEEAFIIYDVKRSL
jgi:UDP-N-acetylglucosamine 2-epimerase